MRTKKNTLSPQQAKVNAEKLLDDIRTLGEAHGLGELDKAVTEFKQAGYPIEAIIPEDQAAGLGNLRTIGGREIWEAYKRKLRQGLCAEGGEFQKAIKSGVHVTVGSVLATIVTALGLPMFALAIAVPVAALIVNTGLDVFCELTEED